MGFRNQNWLVVRAQVSIRSGRQGFKLAGAEGFNAGTAAMPYRRPVISASTP
jgi:hypothetical protein